MEITIIAVLCFAIGVPTANSVIITLGVCFTLEAMPVLIAA